jgi:hypothetical protein
MIKQEEGEKLAMVSFNSAMAYRVLYQSYRFLRMVWTAMAAFFWGPR